ncbi:hypothetical protein HDV03_004847 [Kappamyces sp. JEL0829]|nr:hypothetical protein HDV03_004847 [Kappamyces sp. JEL0829]
MKSINSAKGRTALEQLNSDSAATLVPCEPAAAGASSFSLVSLGVSLTCQLSSSLVRKARILSAKDLALLQTDGRVTVARQSQQQCAQVLSRFESFYRSVRSRPDLDLDLIPQVIASKCQAAHQLIRHFQRCCDEFSSAKTQRPAGTPLQRPTEWDDQDKRLTQMIANTKRHWEESETEIAFYQTVIASTRTFLADVDRHQTAFSKHIRLFDALAGEVGEMLMESTATASRNALCGADELAVFPQELQMCAAPVGPSRDCSPAAARFDRERFLLSLLVLCCFQLLRPG